MNVNNGNLSLSFSLFFAETLRVRYGHWFYCKGRHYSAFQTKRGKLMFFAVKDNWWLSLRIFVAIWLVGKTNFHRNNMPTKIQNPEAEQHLFVRSILPVYSRVHIVQVIVHIMPYIMIYIYSWAITPCSPHATGYWFYFANMCRVSSFAWCPLKHWILLQENIVF